MADARLLMAGTAAVLSGCSGIQFLNHDDGHSHPYHVAMPALKVVTDPDCKMTAEVISIPGRLNYLKFTTGLGKIDDGVEFEPGGTIKKITAKQEGVADDLVKIVGAVTSAAKSAGGVPFTENQKNGCQPSVRIYPINFDAPGGAFVDSTKPVLTIEAQPVKGQTR
jgi:hypothetical protein